MKIIEDNINIDELREMSKNMSGDLVKAVVDIEKEIIAFDAGLHVDLATFLIENSSEQKNLWGFNIYPFNKKGEEDFIEFDSMVNLKPAQGNRSRSVEDLSIQQKIKDIVNKLVKE